MEEIKLKGGCNKDVPVEQTIHYIVKDYRRMYHEHWKLVETIEVLRDKLRKRENEAYHRERRIDKLWNMLEDKEKQLESLKRKLGKSDERSLESLPIYM